MKKIKGFIKKVRQTHPLIMIYFGYLGIIIIFGLVYWGLFNLYPDNFVVNEQLAAYELDYEEQTDSISRLFSYHYKELRDASNKREKMIVEADGLERQWKEIKRTLRILGNIDYIKSMPPQKIDSLIQLKEKLLINEKETFKRIYELEVDSIPSLNGFLSNKRPLVRELIRKKLNLFDFLLYSLGTATATTFGDLTANTIIIKFFTAFELMICIFIVGYMINLISERLKDGNKT